MNRAGGDRPRGTKNKFPRLGKLSIMPTHSVRSEILTPAGYVFIKTVVCEFAIVCGLDAYLLTYLLTPWSRVLPEKLKRPELLKKFPAFYGTRRFTTALTRTRHLSLS
jgi:hypothetical protein